MLHFGHEEDLLVFLTRINPICINQTDDPEKSRQVRLMSRIYHSAALVYAYLGEAHDDSELAMESLSQIGNEALTS